jgi:hypothetical protein
MSDIADSNASAKTNTATAARRSVHCLIADLLLLSIQTFRLPRPQVNAHATGAVSGLPGVRSRLTPIAALGPEEAGHGSRHPACRVAGPEDRQQDQDDEYRQPVGAWWLTFHHTTVNDIVQGFVEQNPILQREARRRRGRSRTDPIHKS